MSATPESGLTRRWLLGAAGSAVAVSLANASTATAADGAGAEPQGRQAEKATPPVAGFAPGADPSLEYYTYPGVAFISPAGIANANGPLGTSVQSPSDMVAPISLPVGTVVREMTVWAANSSGSATYCDLASYANDLESMIYNYTFTVDIPNGQAITSPLTSTGYSAITIDRNYFFNVLGRPGVNVRAVRLGVSPAALSFRTVTPGRVHDSRTANGGAGTLAAGFNRTISVANRINPSGGAMVQSDFVPAGARAVTLNLTAVNTVGAGFLAVNPGGTTAVTASTINWAAGQTLANGIVCQLNGSRQLTVVSGGAGSADFIIDITGYYL